MLNNFKYNLKNPSIFRGVFCLCLYLISITSFSQAIIKVKDTKKSFGFVKKGETVSIKYEVENSGNEPLLISNYKVECSCTTVTLPSAPILPKMKGEIIVNFDTKTVYDRQDRIVEIISNAKNGTIKIRFKGVVLSK
jgi:hypothetical protein